MNTKTDNQGFQSDGFIANNPEIVSSGFQEQDSPDVTVQDLVDAVGVGTYNKDDVHIIIY